MTRKPGRPNVNFSEKEKQLFKRAWFDIHVSTGQMERMFNVSRQTLYRFARKWGYGGRKNGGRAVTSDEWPAGVIFEDHAKADIDRKNSPVNWR